jgi:hypothetical protein
MTYGHHQEAASRALLELLIRDADEPLDAATSELVLACRHQAQLAIKDRLWALGSNRLLGRPVQLKRAVACAKFPVRTLATILREMPPGDVPDLPPSAVLTRPDEPRPAIAEHWRALARHLFLANVDLQHDPTNGARTEEAEWYLIGDIAVTLEALTTLDERFSRTGLFAAPENTLETRLISGDVARAAAWFGHDEAPDLELAEVTEATFGVDGPPIWLIRSPEDFAPAQRALAGFLRPRVLDETVDAYGGRPGLHAARVLSLGQARLAATFAGWADRIGATDLADRFGDRIPRYRALHLSTQQLTEATKSRSIAVGHQMSELVQAIRRFPAPRMSVADLHDLDAATHQATVNAGATLRRQGMARKNILVITCNGAQQITSSRNSFNRACRALADEPANPSPRPSSRHHREQLADVLRSSPWHPTAVPLHRLR